jgi:two-component system OmpR family response regulator
MPKPYDPRELEARIRSLLRREKHEFQAGKGSVKKVKKDIVLDSDRSIIKFKNQELSLTNAEYGILKYLLKKEGGVVSREELIYNVEAISEESTNKSIDVIIGRIRQKLGEVPKDPKYIHSVRGIGYKFTQ